MNEQLDSAIPLCPTCSAPMFAFGVMFWKCATCRHTYNAALTDVTDYIVQMLGFSRYESIKSSTDLPLSFDLEMPIQSIELIELENVEQYRIAYSVERDSYVLLNERQGMLHATPVREISRSDPDFMMVHSFWVAANGRGESVYATKDFAFQDAFSEKGATE